MSYQFELMGVGTMLPAVGGTFEILTEGDDTLLTEGDDLLVTEEDPG